MTRRLVNCILGLIVCVIMAAPAGAAPNVVLNGSQLSFDVSPVIENGTTLVPLRAIFEPLGASVEWDGPTQTVTAVKTGTKIKLTLGQATALKNGTQISLVVPAKSIDGRTMVPLRFVSEALGAQVNWDGNTQVITITSSPISSPDGSPPPFVSANQIQVHFIDVGQADSIYIKLPGNNDILIDGGNKDDSKTVVDYLKKQWVDDLELVIATHPHEDHIGGLPAVLNAFAVDEIIDSGEPATTNIYKEYSAAAKAEGCTWLQDDRQTFTYGNDTFQILTGNETWEDINDYSVVSRLDCGDIEFLFGGDAEISAEAALRGDISAEILKVGHHGSNSSSSSGFLSRVKPQAAIISVGADNTYGHPAPDTLVRLQNPGAKIYRTDLSGTIIVTTDGKTFNVSGKATTVVSPPSATSPISNTINAKINVIPSVTQGQYVGSKNSDKYHLPDCRYAEKIESQNRIWFKDKAEAEAAGYVPCGACKL